MATNISTATLDSARDIISAVKMLPPLPTVAVQIVSRLGDEFIDGNEVADVVDQDPAICARLISLANSAYFGLRSPVGNMRDVVNRVLGTDTVRCMALALATRQTLDLSHCPVFDVKRFWRRALGAAASCKRIAAVVDEVAAGERECAYALGLCHDLGLMALVNVAPDRMQGILSESSETPLADRLTTEFGFSSATMTLAVAEHWELPLLMIDTFRARAENDVAEHPMAMVLNAAIRAAAYTENEDEPDLAEAEALLADASLNVPGPKLVGAALPTDKQREALDGAVEALSS